MASLCSTRLVPWSEIQSRLSASLPSSVYVPLNELMLKTKSSGLFVARYPFGRLIVDRGEFLTPCHTEACAACLSLRAALHREQHYTPIPLVAIVEGCAEVFMEYAQEDGLPRHAPLQLMYKSELFGVFETLDRLLSTAAARPSWSVSSGSRSIWIIAPTGDVRLPKELARVLGTSINWNSDRHPHWKLVEAVIRNRVEWNTEVVIFPQKIVESLKKVPPLFNAILEIGWNQSSRLRHVATEDAELRETLHRALQVYRVPQGELFQYVTIRHLLDMVDGFASAYQVCDGSERAAGPFCQFNTYLKTALERMHLPYQPVIMQPGRLARNGDVGYYSLRCPSVPGPRPAKFKDSLAEIAGSYRQVLRELEGTGARRLSEDSLKFYVKPTLDLSNMPTGVFSSADLPIKDFSMETNGPIRESIFLSSPFLLAVARVVKSTSVVPSEPFNSLQTRSSSRGLST